MSLRLPEFTLSKVDGTSWDSKQIPKGKVTLVMFICNHCPYVQAIESRLGQLAIDLDKIGVMTVAICSNDSEEYPEDHPQELHRRWREKNFSFVYLHDETQSVAKAFGAACTPDFFLFNQDHQLCYRGRLDDNWKDASRVQRRELFEAARALVDGKSPITYGPSMGCSIKWK